MTRRINQVFKHARTAGRKVLIPYIMAGDPNMDTTCALVEAIDRAGADVIELGVPFSDPIADGPVILRAAMRSLTHDTSLAETLRTVEKLRQVTQIPIVFMTYYNLIYQYGEEAFARDAVAAGVDGVIIPDLPPEEGANLISAARENGLATIFLLAPTSNEARITRVCRQATGFVYYVSITGITGARITDQQDVAECINRIRQHTTKPIAVGFGISTPEQARSIGQMADGVIVGSALVRIIEEQEEAGAGKDAVVRAAAEFVGSLRTALDR
ncbi:MAG: tryptophan synthase subunit alpha [Leptospirillia bacterium]